MSAAPTFLFVTEDTGLATHWQHAVGVGTVINFEQLHGIQATAAHIAWIDADNQHLPAWTDVRWRAVMQRPHMRIIATSSNPQDAQAIPALDAGCAAYCHAYASSEALQQVTQVVRAGHVWVGSSLMQRLLHSAQQAAPAKPSTEWAHSLTQREQEVAVLAAKGASNLAIAQQCSITERTVKAHLTSIFTKLGLADRLQLALRVHGIQ